MSNKITPCEKLGYKVGDNFTVIEKSYMFNVGDVAILQSDDRSSYPLFTNDKVSGVYPNGVACYLANIKPIAKLKPAKQALADAIHQNGGWMIAGDYNLVTSNHRGVVKFFHEKPRRDGVNWVGGSCSLAWVDLHQQLPSWHQCILSRDEYFTAYPERKVEAEMKSESEMTIKVNDWHKSGELPPVGEVCEYTLGSSAPWYRCEIKYVINGDGVVMKRIPCGSEQYCSIHSSHPVSFRPLRTERDKEIDEMVDCLAGRWANCEELAKHLYENGYRKEVK